MDPTVVFHGVTEDPCWALANKEPVGSSAGGESGNTGTMTLRSSTGASSTVGGSLRSHYGGRGGDSISSGYVGIGTLGSIHSANKLNLFPAMAGSKHGGGSSLTNTIGSAVMTMTTDRRGLAGSGGGIYGHTGVVSGAGGVPLMISGSGAGAGLYSFRPEHVPVHHGSSGQMHRSYSQSMEDLRYLQ